MNPAWLVSEDDNNPYNVGEYFDENLEYSSPYDENPRDIRTISFSPNGDVLDGNVYQKGILDILDEYQPKKCDWCSY